MCAQRLWGAALCIPHWAKGETARQVNSSSEFIRFSSVFASGSGSLQAPPANRLPASRCVGLRRRALPAAVPGPHHCPVTEHATCPRTPLSVAKQCLYLHSLGLPVTTFTSGDLISLASKNKGPGWASFLSQAMAPLALLAQPPAGCHREHGSHLPPDCGDGDW